MYAKLALCSHTHKPKLVIKTCELWTKPSSFWSSSLNVYVYPNFIHLHIIQLWRPILNESATHMSVYVNVCMQSLLDSTKIQQINFWLWFACYSHVTHIRVLKRHDVKIQYVFTRKCARWPKNSPLNKYTYYSALTTLRVCSGVACRQSTYSLCVYGRREMWMCDEKYLVEKNHLITDLRMIEHQVGLLVRNTN